MTIGVPIVGGEIAIGTAGNEIGNAALVALLVMARRAKSYSPVPLGID